MESKRTNSDRLLISSIALLILSIFAGFVAETTSCNLQSLFKKSMISKHVVVFMLIYFSFSLSHQMEDEPISPTENLNNSVYIFAFYLMFAKLNIYYSVGVMIILFFLLVNKDYADYYHKLNKSADLSVANDKDRPSVKLLDKSFKFGLYALAISMITGFVYYYFKKKQEYKGKFDNLKFLIGNVSCKENS